MYKVIMMIIVCLMLVTVTACSSVQEQQANTYIESTFELCGTDVERYVSTKDGAVRVLCADGSKFSLKTPETLDTMRNISATYCLGGGLGLFSESNDYYMFKCKEGALVSIVK